MEVIGCDTTLIQKEGLATAPFTVGLGLMQFMGECVLSIYSSSSVVDVMVVTEKLNSEYVECS